MSNYQLTTLSGKCLVTLSGEQYDRIANAREATYSAIAIEEKYDLVLANYAEYEAEILNFGLEAFVYGSCFAAAQAHRNRRLTIGRRLLNLLAACRLYLDGTDRTLCAIFGKESDQRHQFKVATANCYDQHLSYRVMEQLRDHVMHRDLPIHATGFREELTRPKAHGKVAFRFVATVSPERLRRDRKIKASVRDEMAGLETSTDITPLLREYVSDISQIHQTVRDVLAPMVLEWDAILVEGVDLLREECSESGIESFFIVSAEDNTEPDRYYFSEASIEGRQTLIKKNPCAISLDRGFVVGDSLES